jgi:predicted ABC-type transport system involved in lysophospholipase L1 biosynthesis ATPase subunit
VDGREVNRMTERERLALRRDRVAFIFQSFGLVPMLSAAENVGGGLVVLRNQGLGSGNSGVYPSATPVLVAIPVAVVVLRCYPLVARQLARLGAGRAG